MSRRSERSERRLFLAEGRNALDGALAGGHAREVLCRPDVAASLPHLPDDVPLTLVDERAAAALSDSVSPSGLVTLCGFLDVAPQDALRQARLVAVCADVRDPGNAGTIVRTADAAGADAVVLAGHSVDLYNPKTLRASAGSVFHLPVAVVPDPAAAVAAVRAAGLTVLAADGAGETDLFAPDALPEGPVAWLFGNEAWGLPAELAALADARVRIPIGGGAESLNLAVAAALCLFESARSRR